MSDSSSNPNKGSLINFGSATATFIISLSIAFLSQLPSGAFSSPTVTYLVAPLVIFNNVNVFIALCEIVLGMHIMLIKQDYIKLREKYRGNERGAIVQLMTMPMTARQLLDGKMWSKMWATYSLYDPSYQNHESFGFFIDFGNGISTLLPTLMMNVAMVFPQRLSPLWAGCIGLAMYWQVMYGTIIYVLSFLFNRRHEGKPFMEVFFFVLCINGLWFFFPMLGIYSCVCMLRDGNMDVFHVGA